MYLASEVLPAGETGAKGASTRAALEVLDSVYAFLYSRVGNRSDAEDLTQEVAVKALPRLREDASAAMVRSYLHAAARSVLADFWSRRLRIREAELPDDVRADVAPAGPAASSAPADVVARVLAPLSPSQRTVLELRFLRGYSLREVAVETGQSVDAVKVMQLRALRKAATTAAF